MDPEDSAINEGQDLSSAAAAIEGLLNDDGHVTDGRPSRAATGDAEIDPEERALRRERDERGRFKADQDNEADERDVRRPNEETEDEADDGDEQELDDADTDESAESEGEEAGEQDAETEAIETLSQLAEALELDVDELSATLKHKFKAAGEEVEVTFAELVKGYQKDADYRRSTARLAEERRALEQQTRQRNEDYVRSQHVAAQQIGLAEQLFTNMLNSPQLAALRESDPAEWAARRDELGQTVQWIQQQRQQAAAAYNDWHAKNLAELRDREMKALREAVPDWGENQRLEVRKTLGDLGYSDDEVAGLFDSRLIRGALELSTLRAENQKLKDRIAKAEASAKRVKKELPKFQKPGKQRSQSPVKRTNLQKLRGRLRQSGDVRDAAAIIEQMM